MEDTNIIDTNAIVDVISNTDTNQLIDTTGADLTNRIIEISQQSHLNPAIFLNLLNTGVGLLSLGVVAIIYLVLLTFAIQWLVVGRLLHLTGAIGWGLSFAFTLITIPFTAPILIPIIAGVF